MTRFATQSFAAIAALFIVTVSMQAIVTVPPAQASVAVLPVLA